MVARYAAGCDVKRGRAITDRPYIAMRSGNCHVKLVRATNGRPYWISGKRPCRGGIHPALVFLVSASPVYAL